MSWFEDKFENLFKKKVDPTSFESIFRRLDADQFFSSLNNLWSPSELIRKMGGYENLYLLYKDQDIYAAIDKRIAALLDTRLVIDGENQAMVEFFERQLRPFERQLKQDFWWTIYNGWGVEQIIYNEDLSGEVVGFQKEEFWRFEPQRDLIHVKLLYTTNNEFRGEILPYGKWVLTTNNGTSYNPFGDTMAERLITPWIFKCNGWDLWLDFAKRFANGFLHAQIEDMEQADSVRSALEKSGKSSIIVTDTNSTLTMHQANKDSTIYQALDERTVRAIQKVILGETQTSDMAARGSSASADIHNEVRLEKTRADIDLVTTALNEVILQIAKVNGFDETQLPKASLIYDPAFNLELASRDVQIHTLGVRFNKDYFLNNYGLKEDEFEVIDVDAIQQPAFGFSAKKKSTFLTPEQMKEFIGKPEGLCAHGFNLNPMATRKGTRQLNEKEDIVQILSRNTNPPLDPEDLVAAILTSKNDKELDEKLNALFDSRNNAFVDDMTSGLYYAATRGALLGNPKVIKNEEE